MSHSDGPWNVGGDIRVVDDKRIRRNVWGPTAPGNQRGEMICQLATVDNARLICAAPELLAMVRRYASECAECGGRGTVERREVVDYVQEIYQADCSDCADIRSLIRHAEGA